MIYLNCAVSAEGKAAVCLRPIALEDSVVHRLAVLAQINERSTAPPIHFIDTIGT
jgi:hypothetical protein